MNSPSEQHPDSRDLDRRLRNLDAHLDAVFAAELDDSRQTEAFRAELRRRAALASTASSRPASSEGGPPSTTQNQVAWLVSDFAERVPGVAHAVVVSSHGLLFTASNRLSLDRADQLAAVTLAMVDLTQGAARCFGAGAVNETVVEMELGIMIFMPISDGSCLAVLAAPNADIGDVAYEMAMLVDRVGQILATELNSDTSYTATSPNTTPPWPQTAKPVEAGGRQPASTETATRSTR